MRSATVSTFASLSSTQSRPVSPASSTPSSTYRAISCARISIHSISGSSIAGKYERELVVIWKPARRNNSTVAFSRLPLGIPNFSFIRSAPVDHIWIVGARLALLPLALIEAAEEATLVAFMADARPEGFHLHQDRVT